MAFVRRKGNTYFLVHNVRRQGKVQQLHLARLGERPRITDDVVRRVSRNHPFLDLDWSQLREQVNGRVELFDIRSPYVQNLMHSLRNLNLDLADLSPPLLLLADRANSSRELVTQLRLLRSTLDVKLDQFERTGPRNRGKRQKVPVGEQRPWARKDYNSIQPSAAWNRAILRRGCGGRSWGRTKRCRRWWICTRCFAPGLNSPGRPVGNLLFLGPTGAGKTRVVEATAEVLFGDPRAVIKVDCAEFQHSHEIAKLIGSPPGYLGHRETHPLITQEALAQYHTEKLKISFLLFDEIEKASDALWQLLLGILDKATLTLGDNRRVDLSQTMIFMTSNLGGVEITELMTGGMGFAPVLRAETKVRLDEKVERTAAEAAKRKFAPEFMNRIDKMVVFHPLRSEQLEQILEIELGMVQQRVLETAKGRFLFRVTQPAREFLLREGTDMKYGARHLKRAIERHVVYPLASLLATEQVSLGDVISIDWHGGEMGLTFLKEAEGALVPMASPATERLADAAAATTDGRTALFPAATAAADLTSAKVVAPPTAARGLPVEKAKNDKK